MTDDQLLLASAYVDGDVDAAARARAEADGEVMAEVARMREVRAALRAVEAPDDDRREQALAAAFAALADEPPQAPPLPARTRSGRSGRSAWVGVAAAAAALVLVAAAGLVVRGVGSGGGNDDDAASVATAQVLDRDEADAPGGASDVTRNEMSALPRDDIEAEDDTAPAGTEVASGGGTALAPAAEELVELTTAQELAAFAEGRSGDEYQGPPPGCSSDGSFLGPVHFAGTRAEVFELDGTLTVLDATTCTVLVTVER